MEQNKELAVAGYLGVLWRYLVSLHSWDLSDICGWVSGSLWPVNRSKMWISQCATRDIVGRVIFSTYTKTLGELNSAHTWLPPPTEDL